MTTQNFVSPWNDGRPNGSNVNNQKENSAIALSSSLSLSPKVVVSYDKLDNDNKSHKSDDSEAAVAEDEGTDASGSSPRSKGVEASSVDAVRTILDAFTCLCVGTREATELVASESSDSPTNSSSTNSNTSSSSSTGTPVPVFPSPREERQAGAATTHHRRRQRKLDSRNKSSSSSIPTRKTESPAAANSSTIVLPVPCVADHKSGTLQPKQQRWQLPPQFHSTTTTSSTNIIYNYPSSRHIFRPVSEDATTTTTTLGAAASTTATETTTTTTAGRHQQQQGFIPAKKNRGGRTSIKTVDGADTMDDVKPLSNDLYRSYYF